MSVRHRKKIWPARSFGRANGRNVILGSFEQTTRPKRGPAVKWTTAAGSLAACAAIVVATAAPPRLAQAKNGDTHVIGEDIEQTVDCNDATLMVNGSGITVTALGNCYAVTVMGSSNTVIADSVSHDITVYGYNQTVFYKNGQPALWDRGRELGMTNRLQQVPG